MIYYTISITRSSDVNQSTMMLGPYTPAGPTDASQIEITLNLTDGILLNVRYHFQILAVNTIGSSSLNGMEFCKD